MILLTSPYNFYFHILFLILLVDQTEGRWSSNLMFNYSLVAWYKLFFYFILSVFSLALINTVSEKFMGFVFILLYMISSFLVHNNHRHIENYLFMFI